MTTTKTEEATILPPDEATKVAAVEAAEAKAAGKTETDIEIAAAASREAQEAKRAKVKPTYYKTVANGVLIDPDTGIEFSNDKGTKSKLTGWLEFQIANGKITEDE